MNLLIIGGSVLDKITCGEKIDEVPGGIYHSVLKFLQIKNHNDILALCTQVSSKSYKYFKEVFEQCDIKYFEEVAQIPTVTIEETSSGYRKEIYSNIATPLNFNKIDFGKFDGILINMITGKELDYDNLREIRNQTKAIIYFDVHTLSRLSSSMGERKFNLISNFERWAESIDIIQVNEFELSSLFGISDEYLVAQRLFNVGVKAIIVTKAEIGAIIYFIDGGELNFYFKQAKRIEGVNSIGCGDYFGTSFFYKFLITKNHFSSLNFAINEVENTLTSRLYAAK